jgi:hypothetical protein
MLSVVTQAARADQAPLLYQPAAASVNMQTMINCRLWLSSINDCLQLTTTAGHNFSQETSSQHTRSAPDYEGIKRDTYYFLGLQLSIVGALYFLPESVSGWSQEQKEEHHADKWWDNVSGPNWDDDEDYINYLLHPYWGASYYVRARERGYGATEAFWYSFLLSTMYEAGVEALFEPVSIQDFFVTPIVGSWLGSHFMDWRNATYKRMKETGETRFRDRALLVATDPLGTAANFVDRRLGSRAEFRARPFMIIGSNWSGHEPIPLPHRKLETTYGVTMTLRW